MIKVRMEDYNGGVIAGSTEGRTDQSSKRTFPHMTYYFGMCSPYQNCSPEGLS
jgi:hypothetical protein